MDEKVIFIYLDDVRTPAAPYWTVVRTAEDCIDLLRLWDDKVGALSLDHDLGTDQTGYDVISWLEEQILTNKLKGPNIIMTHSANPVGVQRIDLAIKNIERYQNA